MNKNIKLNNPISSDRNKRAQSHAGHIWMMILFCGLPLIAFLVLGMTGIRVPSLEALFLIICAIGMIGMMLMMHGDKDEKEQTDTVNKSGQGAHDETGQ